MRLCEGCKKPDEPYYEFWQPCTCGQRQHIHGLEKHDASCSRVWHKVSPYRIHLRRVNKRDQINDSLLQAPVHGRDEYARYRANGFAIRHINGHLYAERILCADCIRIWTEREENRRDYERAKRGPAPQTYYHAICN